MFKNKEKHFTLIEYSLGDSACTNKNFMLSAFTNVSGQSLSDDKTFFNDKMKPARVRVEHCVGLLKNRFQFLKSLRFVLDEEKESMTKIIRHVAVCIMLHNFLIAENDDGNNLFAEEDGHDSDVDAENESNCPVNDATDEQERRNQMTECL